MGTNNLVPSPNTYSRPLHDAHRCAAALLNAAATAEAVAATTMSTPEETATSLAPTAG